MVLALDKDNPNAGWYGFALGWSGQYDAAAAQRYARAGRPEDARRIFAELEEAADKIAKHEPDEGFFQIVNLKLNFTNDPVLREPEFVEALERLRPD